MNLIQYIMPLKTNKVGPRNSDIQPNKYSVNTKSKISFFDEFIGQTTTERAAFTISILLIVLSFFDLLFTLEELKAPENWYPVSSIIGFAFAIIMPILLSMIAYRKMNATVTPLTVTK